MSKTNCPEAFRSKVVRVAIVTLFPEMFSALTESGITRRAVEQGLIEFAFFNPREFTHDKHQTVDDRPYGGGPGMVMRVEPLANALEASLQWLDCDRIDARVVYMSPQGQAFSSSAADEFGEKNNLVMICGRYEGIDERFIEEFVDEEWSIGDYVLSGGELPAMVVLDAVIRKLPGALGDVQSAEQDSYEAGLLDCQHYTRPEEVRGKVVPAILMSGDHEKIRQWRLKQSLGRTLSRRPDLLAQLELSNEQLKLLEEYRNDI